MAKETPEQVYAEDLAAGFSITQAILMTAIAEAESGLDNAAVGDIALENATWGPSYGLDQVRTLKAQTGSGSDRDINALATGGPRQARAAYDISSGGRDFTPWTTYTTGKYQQYLGQAQAAAAAVNANPGAYRTAGSSAAPAGLINPGPFGLFGPSWVPWAAGAIGGTAIDQATAGGLSGARQIALEGAFVILGLALLGVGIATAVAPRLRERERQIKATARDAVT